MRELARKLAKGLQQVRVDFYDINGQIYFGELTFSISQAIVLFSLLNGMKGLVAGGLWKNSFLGNTLRHLLGKSQTSLM